MIQRQETSVPCNCISRAELRRYDFFKALVFGLLLLLIGLLLLGVAYERGWFGWLSGRDGHYGRYHQYGPDYNCGAPGLSPCQSCNQGNCSACGNTPCNTCNVPSCSSCGQPSCNPCGNAPCNTCNQSPCAYCGQSSCASCNNTCNYCNDPAACSITITPITPPGGPTITMTPTPTNDTVDTVTVTSTSTATETPTNTPTGTLTETPSATPTTTPENPPTSTATPSPTSTETPQGPAFTPTVTPPPPIFFTPTVTPFVPTATLTPTRLAGNACTRFNFELGRDLTRGSHGDGVYVMREVNGPVVVTWNAQDGDLDSGWLNNLYITKPTVWVTVTFYPADGRPPIPIEIINPAPGTPYGWLSNGTCSAIELQFPLGT